MSKVQRRPKAVEDEIVAYIKGHYHYDYCCGCVRRRDGSRLKGCRGQRGYICICFRLHGKTLKVKLHQVVFTLHYGRMPRQVDHINGDPTDNHFENLREVTLSDNNRNRYWTWRPNPKTGVPGVYVHNSGLFQAYLRKEKLRHSDKYGLFQTITLLGRNYQAT